MNGVATRGKTNRLAIAFSALLAVAISLGHAAAQAPERRYERGFPSIQTYDQRVHSGGPQNFDIAQDERGILYFGNLAGVVTYDGARWRLIKLPNDASAGTIEADGKGRVVLASVNEFGYFDADPAGSVVYRSLMPQLPPESREFGDVWGLCSTSRGFFLISDKYLIRWDGGAPSVVMPFASRETTPRNCYEIGGSVWFAGNQGLQRLDLEHKRLETTSLAGRKTRYVLDGGDGSLIVAVTDVGLFRVVGAEATPFAPEASKWLAAKWMTGATRLLDGRFAITTRDSGVLIIRPDGAIDQIIGPEAGIPDSVLAEPYADREGALWLAFHGPIARLDLASPVTVLDSRVGVKGSVSHAARFSDRLYIATSHGLFALDGEGAQAHARKIESIPLSASNLLPDGDRLLVGTGDGMFVLDAAGKAKLVEGTVENGAFAMLRSRKDPDLVWFASGTGIGIVRRKAGAWAFDRMIEGSPAYTSTMLERDGVLWCGTVYDGAVRIEDPLGAKPRVTEFNNGEEINVFEVDGRIVFTRPTSEICELNAAGQLVRDAKLGRVGGNSFWLIAEDAAGNVWLNTIPPRLIRKRDDGTYTSEGEPLVQADAPDFQFLNVDAEGTVWFGADRGLYRYEPGAVTRRFAQPAPLIRRVIMGSDRLLFGGASQANIKRAVLPSQFRRLRAEFAPASFRAGVQYQYRLEPVDADWGRWSDEPFVDFTNLDPGDYTLFVRTRGADGTSDEVQWSFAVANPWYRTPWAIAIWILVAALAVIAFVQIRTHALLRDAEELRLRVAERTEELRQTVEQLRDAQSQLVHKNELLEVANVQLEQLSLVDDLTGLSNRRHFQRALTDEWKRAVRNSDPIAFILLDLDRFKELNDRLGHPAGDACLRKIGEFLASSVRRAGEVVARYGGEEFAVLLPRTQFDEALRIAESLRSGIEGLRMASDAGVPMHVTTSAGITVMRPLAGESMDALIERADRALYSAKRSGRNRICVATDTGVECPDSIGLTGDAGAQGTSTTT